MALFPEDDPDQQLPMPFQAADDYACVVMRWARELPAARMNIERAVAYGDDRLHRYDVFSAAGASNAPVVVFWHGGGWTNGYRDYNAFMAPHLTGLGCVLVSPSYRLVGQARLPAAYDDSLRMLAHVAGNIGRFGGDGRRLYLCGHSAGGHLAALVALRLADRSRAGVPDSAVRGCLPISGIMDLHHPSPAPGSLEERVYSMVLEDASLDAVMSPICWTAGNRVPFLLTVGENDSERVRRSNARMLELLKLQHASAGLRVMPGQDHFQTHTSLRDAAHPWYRSLADMMERTAG